MLLFLEDLSRASFVSYVFPEEMETPIVRVQLDVNLSFHFSPFLCLPTVSTWVI